LLEKATLVCRRLSHASVKEVPATKNMLKIKQEQAFALWLSEQRL
jgi:hypothetical protein